MSKAVVGRVTHRHSGELVVFHIGLQINRWWRPDLWLPPFLAMPRMLRELSTEADSGLLGAETLFGGGGPYVVQYWSSIDKLYAYASDVSQEHRPAWARFNRAARKAPGAVGIWHETLLVERAESVYVSTPTRGLAKATRAVEVSGNHDRARARLGDGRTASNRGSARSRTVGTSSTTASATVSADDSHPEHRP